MYRSHNDKQERRRLAIRKGGPRIVCAGASTKARNVVSLFLAFVVAFGMTFGFFIFGGIKLGSASSSASVAEEFEPWAAQKDIRGTYGEYSAAVASDGTFEIGSLSDLLIAAHFYDAEVESYTSFRLMRDISGKFTADDIEKLNIMFPSGWGYEAEGALKNVLKGRVDDEVTILDSLFGNFTGTFDGNGYVIDGFDLVGGASGGHSDNAGLFAVIGAGAVVKDLHLRNVNVVAKNVTSVGGLAGTSLSDLINVSVHGTFNVTGGDALGGIVGTLGDMSTSPALDKAIVLGEMYANGVKFAGGAVGSNTGGGQISSVVSMMSVWSTGGGMLVGGIFAGGSTTYNYNNPYIANSVWIDGQNKVHVNNSYATPASYSALNEHSNSGYVEGQDAYYISKTSAFPYVYDVLDNVSIDEMAYEGDVSNAPAPRQSMRLCDIIDVYLLQYDILPTTTVVDGKTYNIYVKPESSWLVGKAKGTESDPIIIANRQGAALLRELRFATFRLVADVYMSGTYKLDTPYRGAFFGQICNKKTDYDPYDQNGQYDENGFHIYIKDYDGKQLFEAAAFAEISNGVFPLKKY